MRGSQIYFEGSLKFIGGFGLSEKGLITTPSEENTIKDPKASAEE
jgi:hypothetical protein